MEAACPLVKVNIRVGDVGVAVDKSTVCEILFSIKSESAEARIVSTACVTMQYADKSRYLTGIAGVS